MAQCVSWHTRIRCAAFLSCSRLTFGHLQGFALGPFPRERLWKQEAVLMREAVISCPGWVSGRGAGMLEGGAEHSLGVDRSTESTEPCRGAAGVGTGAREQGHPPE